MKVSIHTANRIDTRLAVGRIRERDRVRVRFRISYSQASRVSTSNGYSHAYERS